MDKSTTDSVSDSTSPAALRRMTPRHGFQGDRAPRPIVPLVPPALTIAISRQAGARGTTIAHRAGRLLGWEVYDQELLEYIAQEGAFRQRVLDGLSSETAAWLEQRHTQLFSTRKPARYPAVSDLARLILALGAQGEVILVGRGAGSILPVDSTLHVRIVAPVADRIAYMSQSLRLTIDEATQEVATRDRRRAEFIEGQFQRQPSDVYQYDLVLNTGLLGEEISAEIIAQTALAKNAARTRAHEARET